VTSDHFGQTRIYVAVCALALMAALARARAQSPEPAGSAIVHGYVRDSSRRPLANATVPWYTGLLSRPSLHRPRVRTRIQRDGIGLRRFERAHTVCTQR